MLDNVLFEYQDQLLRNTPITMTRYLYHQIAWDSRMIGIVGSRGIGKSTLLLQYIKRHQDSAKHLYVSAHTAWFAQHTLIRYPTIRIGLKNSNRFMTCILSCISFLLVRRY